MIDCPACGHRFNVGRAPLTPKQIVVYVALRAYMKSHPHAPSLRELAALAGLSGQSASHRFLSELEARGWISRRPGKARAITLTRED